MATCLSPGPVSVLDLGSSGGVPGLILALSRPESTVILLDSRRRACQFLGATVVELGIAGRVEVSEGRAEAAARQPPLREAQDVVVARSFGPPAVTAECAAGFLRLGGRLIVSEPPGGQAGTAEGRWDRTGLEELGLTEPVAHRTADGSFVVLVKDRLDSRWPRRVGIPAKRPLWSS